MKLVLHCPCGSITTIKPYEDSVFHNVVRVGESWFSDDGTGYPSEVWLICPACKQKEQFI